MREHVFERSPNPEKLKEEYSFGGGYALRWLLYEFVEDGIDFHEESRRRLQLQGDESVLDIGCGQGGFLKDIETEGHTGTLIGLDTNDTLAYANKNTVVNFVQADASCLTKENLGIGLPFKTNSFGLAAAILMLYHVSSPRSTLQELSRVVLPGGKIAIATSGSKNKLQHRQFEDKIGDNLGVTKPARYTRTFTSETADSLLPQLFPEVELAFDQRTCIRITEEDLLEDWKGSNGVLSAYIGSIKSMARQFGRNDAERAKAASNMNRAIAEVVLPKILDQIKTTGSFVETIHRSLYICTNDK